MYLALKFINFLKLDLPNLSWFSYLSILSKSYACLNLPFLIHLPRIGNFTKKISQPHYLRYFDNKCI